MKTRGCVILPWMLIWQKYTRQGLNSSVPIQYGSERRDVKIMISVLGHSITRKEIDYVTDAAVHA